MKHVPDILYTEVMVLQHQANEWSGYSRLLFHLLIPKTYVMYCLWLEDASAITL